MTAPLVLTVLAIPGSVVLLFIVALGGMGLGGCTVDSCTGIMVQLGIGLVTGVASLVPVLAVWLFPRRRRYAVIRWLTLVVYLLLAGATAVLILSIPFVY
jgi:hypothetical protein